VTQGDPLKEQAPFIIELSARNGAFGTFDWQPENIEAARRWRLQAAVRGVSSASIA
jgi:hypothetical protein